MKEMSLYSTHSWGMLSFSYNQDHSPRNGFMLRMVIPSIKIWKKSPKNKNSIIVPVAYHMDHIFQWVAVIYKKWGSVFGPVYWKMRLKWFKIPHRYCLHRVLEGFITKSAHSNPPHEFSLRLAILQERENVVQFLALHFVCVWSWPSTGPLPRCC